MNKLTLAPDIDSYTLDFAPVALASSVGVNAVYGQVLLNKWQRLNVSWTCDKTEFNYLTNVYRAHEASGHAPFLIDLFLSPKSSLVESTAIIVPGSFGLQSQSGETFVVGCSLEVKQ